MLHAISETNQFGLGSEDLTRQSANFDAEISSPTYSYSNRLSLLRH